MRRSTGVRESAGRMGLRLQKTVVLVGMMGAGKTAVGRALAASLGVPFLDSDAEIALAANMSIAEIFARDGESFFREKERQVIRRLLGARPCVLSTGGGAFLRADNRAMIHEMGISVWLDADLELLWQRVKGKDTRPLLRTADPRATLAALYETRRPLYAEADLRVQARPEYSIADMAGAVLQALSARPDVMERTGT